ncbi:MAG: MASE1 domain-containing protein [Gemmatimonadota bacterium]
MSGGLAFTLLFTTLGLLTLRPGYFGLQLELERAVWFPSGLALAYIMLAGRRAWPWIFVAEGLITVMTLEGRDANPIVAALGTGSGGAVEALLASWLLTQIGFSTTLSRWRDVVALIGLGAGVSSLVGSLVSVFFIMLTDPPTTLGFPELVLRWWMTHAQGILILTPVILAFFAGQGLRTRDRPWEAAVLGGLVALVSGFLFGSRPGWDPSEIFLYLPFPLLLWAAFRFGLAGAALANLVLILPALLGTAQDLGPILAATPTLTLLHQTVFVGVCVLTSLVVAGTVEEREAAAEARLKAEEERRRLNDRIHQTQKLESLGILAGGIAHDFNNLLVSIMGNADLAERQLPRDHEAGDNVAEILRASRRASDLCRQILAYAGRGQVQQGVVDLDEVVREMGELLSVSFPKDAVVEIRSDPDLPPVWGDVTQLRQVVLNLLTNAADALPGGAGRIVVETGMIRPEGISAADLVTGELPAPGTEMVHFTVTDDGMGMEEELRTRVFEPFYSTKSAGRGLGLAVVQGIVRSHSGLLELSTSPGVGSRFRLILPSTQRERLPPAEPAVDWLADGTQLSGRVLLVDDEPSVRRVARRMLEDVGLEVLEAADGVEAVECFRREKDALDVVVMDITMPRMDGYQALREMRAEVPGVRVLLVTGNVADLDLVREMWGVPLLTKPYRAQELQELLSEILLTERKVG